MEKETDIPATPRMVIDSIHGELKLVSVELKKKETDKYTDEQIDAAVSQTADEFFKRPVVDPPGTVYWVPSRTFHPVYRKGDGLWKWLKCKWWDWKDNR